MFTCTQYTNNTFTTTHSQFIMFYRITPNYFHCLLLFICNLHKIDFKLKQRSILSLLKLSFIYFYTGFLIIKMNKATKKSFLLPSILGPPPLLLFQPYVFENSTTTARHHLTTINHPINHQHSSHKPAPRHPNCDISRTLQRHPTTKPTPQLHQPHSVH